jgi:hypothetical protein
MSEIEQLTDEERSDVEEIGFFQCTHVESHYASARRTVALEKALRILDAQAKRIAELERFAAATVLDWRDREGQGPEFEDMPTTVAALVREHHGKEIGICRNCGKRAPIVDRQPPAEDFAPPTGLCAWGCAATPQGRTGPLTV